jgi:hypothetical protein
MAGTTAGAESPGDSVAWLSAIKAEVDADYAGAATLYLRDAEECLAAGSATKSALSCFCAADCLRRLGATLAAGRLYQEAGMMYMEIANRSFSKSMQETVWALQRAHASFLMAEGTRWEESFGEEFAAERRSVGQPGGTWGRGLTPAPPYDRMGGLSDATVEALRRFLTKRRSPRTQPATMGLPSNPQVGGQVRAEGSRS